MNRRVGEKIRLFTLFVVFVTTLFPAVHAETITLKNGKVIEGTIIEKADDYVTVDSQGRIWKIRFRLMEKGAAEQLKKIPSKTKRPPKQENLSIADVLNKSQDPSQKSQPASPPAVPSQEMDFDVDGNSDQWEYLSPDGLEKRVERDSDFDGTVDSVRWEHYRDRDKGLFLKILYDDNNDGKVDAITYYDTNGIWMEKTLDTDGDAILDTVFTCHGKDLEKVTIDLNNDGLPDIVQRYQKGRFVSAEVDSDFDGAPDRVFKEVKPFNRWFSGSHFERIPRYLNVLNSFEIKYR